MTLRSEPRLPGLHDRRAGSPPTRTSECAAGTLHERRERSKRETQDEWRLDSVCCRGSGRGRAAVREA